MRKCGMRTVVPSRSPSTNTTRAASPAVDRLAEGECLIPGLDVLAVSVRIRDEDLVTRREPGGVGEAAAAAGHGLILRDGDLALLQGVDVAFASAAGAVDRSRSGRRRDPRWCGPRDLAAGCAWWASGHRQIMPDRPRDGVTRTLPGSRYLSPGERCCSAPLPLC